MRISIITPSFNQAQFLETTIISVLNQSWHDLEYIVIDGGSVDGSVNIIRRYEKELAYWVSEPDDGQTDAINKGMRRATGEIVAYLNSDDCYMAGTLALVADYFEKDSKKRTSSSLATNQLFTSPQGQQQAHSLAHFNDPYVTEEHHMHEVNRKEPCSSQRWDSLTHKDVNTG